MAGLGGRERCLPPLLRTITLDGTPWFVAADVCRILGFPIGGPAGGTTRYLKRLANDERRTVRPSSGGCYPLFSHTKAPSQTLITESGLYKLIMRSDKPGARVFQDWVTREVLPSIRETGG